MSDRLGTEILKGVSRSFYLTLRILPRPMREPASLGYLLARISDTIADTTGVKGEARLALLEDFRVAVEGGGAVPAWPAALLEAAEEKERLLLARAADILAWLERVPDGEALLIREVVGIIISGQSLDLIRFGSATRERPVALAGAAELEDYTWRVAGCVGAFWTKLGFLTLGEAYSSEAESVLIGRGIDYGKGLQLVNILRDLPRDLEAGRCYLPASDPADLRQLMEHFRVWHGRACGWIGDGIWYSQTLRFRRLRASTVLPALIAEETLQKLDGVSWEDLRRRVKVPRHHIYRLLMEALLF